MANVKSREDQKKSVGFLIVECLENEGVEYVFGIPGEENIRLVDAFNGSSIRFILVRHEQGASFMADIYGRLTGKAGVCAATLGPGAINLLLGVADAQTDSVPLVAISAQGGLNRLYKESHQVIDLVAMFKPATKWSETVLTPAAVPEMVRKAFKVAQTERPGAVYLAVPEDIEAMPAPLNARPLSLNVVRDDAPSPSQIARAAHVLSAAKNPIILAGHGAARGHAQEALIRFSEKLKIPVATTFHGKGVFSDDHPYALGAMGFMRHDYVNFGFDQADVIVAVGYDLQEFTPARMNPTADKQIIHIQRYPAEVDDHYHVAVGIEGSIPAALDALSAGVPPRDEVSPGHLTGVARGGLSMNTAGGGIQRRIQRERSVPVVFKPMALNAAGGERQNRVEPIKCLNRRLFINAEHGGMLRWVQIQSDNVGGFRLKVRIIACHIPIQPMRLQPSFFPNAMDGILADAQLRGELAATPLRGTIPGLSARSRQNPGSRFGVSTEGGCPGWLVSSPSSPEARKRCFHRMMVGAVVASLCLIALNDAPSASIRISLARNTYPAGRDRD